MSILKRLFSGQKSKPAVPLETQLQQLAASGIRLKSAFSLDDLLYSFPRERYECDPYRLALVMLGSQREKEPFPDLSDDIWHLDTECVEDHGSYVRIAKRVQALAGDALPLSDIQDHVEIDEGEIWLSFKLRGEEIKWTPAVKDDWLDTAILSNFAKLVADSGSGKRLTYLDLRGQD